MNNIQVGSRVTAAKTVVVAAHLTKTGKHVPEKLITVVREGIVTFPDCGGWIVEWTSPSGEKQSERFFAHEITVDGDNPLSITHK